MPTPFMHLDYAEQLRLRLATGDLSETTALLTDNWPAFYLGSIAPDYQVICDVARDVSHFYPLPLPDGWDAAVEMLRQHPQLAAGSLRDASQQTFVAAYLVHLLLDMVWYREVLLPYFVVPDHLGAGHDRMVLHNFTLMLLDRQAYDKLPTGAGAVLAEARPSGWLPFAKDEQLEAWQALIGSQLEPGAIVQTVPIYADRMGIPVGKLASQLEDPVWLERELLSKVPLPDITVHMEAALDSAMALIVSYFDHTY